MASQIFRGIVSVTSKNGDHIETGKFTVEGENSAAVDNAVSILASTNNTPSGLMDVRKMVGAFNVGGMVRAKYKSDTIRKNAATPKLEVQAPVKATVGEPEPANKSKGKGK